MRHNLIYCFSFVLNDDEKFTDKIYENIAHHKFKQFYSFITGIL